MGTFNNRWQNNNRITEFSGSLISTGSINHTGSISATTISGDGSGLTGLGTSATASYVNASNSKLSSLGGIEFNTQQMQDEAHSSGRVKGGEISVLGNAFLVNSGSGMIRASVGVDTVYRFDFVATQSIFPVNTTRYVGVQYNAGSPNVIFKSIDTWDNDTDFPLGTVVRDETGLHYINNPQDVVNHIHVMANRSYETMPFTRDKRNGGLTLSSANGKISSTAGTFWDRLSSYDITAKDTNVSDTFDYYYRISGSVNFTASLNQTNWNSSSFDNGNGLQPLSSSYYTNAWVFVDADDALAVMYGQNQYATQSDAEGENVPGRSSRPPRIKETCYYVGQIVIQSGSSTPVTVYNSYDVKSVGAAAGGGGGGVSVHNDLTGLQGGTTGEYYHLTSAEYADLGSASDITANTTRIQSLESVTGSYATTGSNTFIGNQTISGSLTVTSSINAYEIGSVPTWLKFTKTFSDFNVAATQVSTSIYNLPAGAIIQGAVTKPTTAFDINVSMSLGINSEKDRYADLFDAQATVNDTTFGVWQNWDMQDWGASTPIVLYATSSVNLSTATAGAIDVYLYVSQVKR